MDEEKHLSDEEIARLGRMAEAAGIMDEMDREAIDGDERTADRAD